MKWKHAHTYRNRNTHECLLENIDTRQDTDGSVLWSVRTFWERLPFFHARIEKRTKKKNRITPPPPPTTIDIPRRITSLADRFDSLHRAETCLWKEPKFVVAVIFLLLQFSSSFQIFIYPSLIKKKVLFNFKWNFHIKKRIEKRERLSGPTNPFVNAEWMKISKKEKRGNGLMCGCRTLLYLLFLFLLSALCRQTVDQQVLYWWWYLLLRSSSFYSFGVVAPACDSMRHNSHRSRTQMVISFHHWGIAAGEIFINYYKILFWEYNNEQEVVSLQVIRGREPSVVTYKKKKKRGNFFLELNGIE